MCESQGAQEERGIEKFICFQCVLENERVTIMTSDYSLSLAHRPLKVLFEPK